MKFILSLILLFFTLFAIADDLDAWKAFTSRLPVVGGQAPDLLVTGRMKFPKGFRGELRIIKEDLQNKKLYLFFRALPADFNETPSEDIKFKTPFKKEYETVIIVYPSGQIITLKVGGV